METIFEFADSTHNIPAQTLPDHSLSLLPREKHTWHFPVLQYQFDFLQLKAGQEQYPEDICFHKLHWPSVQGKYNL